MTFNNPLAFRSLFAIWVLGAALIANVGWGQTAATRREAGVAGSRAGDVHLDSSRVYIHVFKTGLGHEHAIVGRLKQGRILLATNARSVQSGGVGELVFDMLSFDADSDEARRVIGLPGSTDAGTREQVNANMHGGAVLDTQTFPTATFKIKSITRLDQPSRRGLPQYQLDGDFTLHGVTNATHVIAESETKNGWLRLRGGFSILQSHYGIKPFKKAFGAVGVADRLDIWVAREGIVNDQAAPR